MGQSAVSSGRLLRSFMMMSCCTLPLASMLAETVHSCTAGTPAGAVLEEAYNSCGQGGFQCFLEAMGWMDASGNVQHDAIMDDLKSLPEETADCLMDAAEDIYDSLTQEQIDAIASHPLVAEILNDFDFEQLFSKNDGADFGDYPFDGSMLAETVNSCTAGTPAGAV